LEDDGGYLLSILISNGRWLEWLEAGSLAEIPEEPRITSLLHGPEDERRPQVLGPVGKCLHPCGESIQEQPGSHGFLSHADSGGSMLPGRGLRVKIEETLMFNVQGFW
jgi:hypothetical protein